MVYAGAWGKLIREKKQKSKISRYCPFKWTGTGMAHSMPRKVVFYYTNSSSEIESTHAVGGSCMPGYTVQTLSSRSFFFSGGAVGGGE